MINRCPICASTENPLGIHLRQQHGEEAFRFAVLEAKARGMSDAEIGAVFGISFHQLEQMITETYGVNISSLTRRKRIRAWGPGDFREETTTVWSFKKRGDWVTHDGRYRGNWSPYIPRNVILKYSQPGDLVLDYFVGGGTTTVEAKLLGRRCIGIDINPFAIQLTRENLRFEVPAPLRKAPIYEPEVYVGDARDLSRIPSGTVDLICAHPPYAGIVRYSTQVEGDLSALPVPRFLEEMGKVAQESMRVLKPGAKCVLLLGDARQSRYVIPIGFQTIRVFLNAGFVLKELVIKRQHNCKTTGFWRSRSLAYNFLLLAHEYLPVFEKPTDSGTAENIPTVPCGLSWEVQQGTIQRLERDESLETTSVWLFPPTRWDSEIRRNLLSRFAAIGDTWLQVHLRPQAGSGSLELLDTQKVGLIYIYGTPGEILPGPYLSAFLNVLKGIAERCRQLLRPGGFLVIEAEDLRDGAKLLPGGLLVAESLSPYPHIRLKEIVIVAPKELSVQPHSSGSLQIVHRYLLIFQRQVQV